MSEDVCKNLFIFKFTALDLTIQTKRCFPHKLQFNPQKFLLQDSASAKSLHEEVMGEQSTEIAQQRLSKSLRYKRSKATTIFKGSFMFTCPILFLYSLPGNRFCQCWGENTGFGKTLA